MSRYFVIGVATVTENQQKALRTYLGEIGTWWNWISGFWLFVADEDIEARTLRDKTQEITNAARCLVVEVTPVTWSGLGPSGEDKNMFKWIRRNWNAS